MMMTIENSQYMSKPQNPNPVDYTGSFITLVSKYGLRYEGCFYHLNYADKTLCLVNVVCYGTEGRNHIGFQIPPSYDLYSFIVFRSTHIKNVIVNSHASLLARVGLSSKIYRSPKPPLPYNQHGAKICQKVPLLISNEKFSKTEDYDASSVNDGLQIACKPLALPQYPGSNYYDPWLNHVYSGSNYYYPWSNHDNQSMPCSALYQELRNTAPTSIASQSFFTTFLCVPISLRPVNGGSDFEVLTKNFKPYQLWGPQRDNKQEDQTAYTVDRSSYQNETWSSQRDNNQEDETAYTSDGSFYMNSHNPFDHIGRPFNPFGPIESTFSFLPSSHELADLGFV